MTRDMYKRWQETCTGDDRRRVLEITGDIYSDDRVWQAICTVVKLGVRVRQDYKRFWWKVWSSIRKLVPKFDGNWLNVYQRIFKVEHVYFYNIRLERLCLIFSNEFLCVKFMEISTVVLMKNILKVDNVFPYFAIILLGKGRGPSSKQIETLSSKDILCAKCNSCSWE